MPVVAIVNRKGGAGKTTTSQSFGLGLKQKGFRVLFIDMDGQGNLSTAMEADKSQPTIFDVLMKRNSLKEAIQTTQQGDIVASSNSLAFADVQITETGKEYRLKEAIENMTEYDYIILDTPPTVGILTINALSVADGTVVPIQPDAFSLEGLDQISEVIDVVKKYCNLQLKIKGILLTRYNGRTILGRAVAEILIKKAAELHTKLYKTVIRECIAIREAQLKKKSIYEYEPNSNGSIDYKNFVDEYLSDN
jgi:chromosome partitioning protein